MPASEALHRTNRHDSLLPVSLCVLSLASRVQTRDQLLVIGAHGEDPTSLLLAGFPQKNPPGTCGASCEQEKCVHPAGTNAWRHPSIEEELHPPIQEQLYCDFGDLFLWNTFLFKNRWFRTFYARRCLGTHLASTELWPCVTLTRFAPDPLKVLFFTTHRAPLFSEGFHRMFFTMIFACWAPISCALC